MRLFDAYLAIDWSASNIATPAKPSKDALWLGEAIVDESGSIGVQKEVYFRTRKLCVTHVGERLLAHAKANRRVFVGFDFPYGYPAGYAAALGLTEDAPAWRLIWDELSSMVVDDEKNASNRFEVANKLNARCGGATIGPMWGYLGKAPDNLTVAMWDFPEKEWDNLKATKIASYPYNTKSGHHLNEYRIVEKQLRGAQPVWKLAYTGSVGSQTLVGIPKIQSLRDDPQLASFSSVWPFETGFTDKPTPLEGAFVLHAEIWPGIFELRNYADISIRDQAQVRTVVEQLAELDKLGELGILFASPQGLSEQGKAVCENEEGWIIGAKMK